MYWPHGFGMVTDGVSDFGHTLDFCSKFGICVNGEIIVGRQLQKIFSNPTIKSTSFDYATARRVYEMVVNTALNAYSTNFRLTVKSIEKTREKTLDAAFRYLKNPNSNADVIPEALRDYI